MTEANTVGIHEHDVITIDLLCSSIKRRLLSIDNNQEKLLVLEDFRQIMLGLPLNNSLAEDIILAGAVAHDIAKKLSKVPDVDVKHWAKWNPIEQKFDLFDKKPDPDTGGHASAEMLAVAAETLNERSANKPAEMVAPEDQV